MPNKRLHYGCWAIGIGRNGTNTFTAVHGVQTAGMSVRYNLDLLSEIGQLETYESSEDLPDVEITLEKLLDAQPPIYCLATYPSTDATIAGRQNTKSSVAFSYFSDVQSSASGTPISQCVASGMFPQQLSWDINVDGPCRESVTLVGNNIVWLPSAYTFTNPFPTNADLPLTGVNRRQHILFAQSIMPSGIPGITTQLVNNMTVQSDGCYTVPIQSIRPSVNYGRSNIFQLGRKAPYFRYVEFPVTVTCEIAVNSIQGHGQGATEDGILGGGINLAPVPILIKMADGTKIDLGSQNKLASVSSAGGNAGEQGSNVVDTYTYENRNSLKVTHPNDPSGLS